MKKIIIALSVVIISIGAYSQKKDSIPPLKTYSVSLNPIQWQQKMDTLSFLIGNFGKSLSVDNSDYWKAAATQVLNSFAVQIRNEMAKDTLPIAKPKK